MSQETAYGFPVATAENLIEVIESLGVKPWPRLKPSLPLDEYLKSGIGEEAVLEAQRFSPRNEVVFLEQPGGQPFTGFRSIGKDWGTVFAVLPGDIIIIVAEWKHGTESLTIVPPSGVPTKAEMAIEDVSYRMAVCSKREYEEETGIELEKVIPLTNTTLPGAGVSTRQSTQRFFPHLGIVKLPIVQGPRKLDTTEHLKGIAISIPEWLKFLDQGGLYEDCAGSITLLALRHLNRLQLTS